MDSLHEVPCSLDELMPVIRESLSMGKSVRFSPRGTSMLPMLRQGVDSVRLSPAPSRLRKFDLPLYQRKNGQYVLHRVVKAGTEYTCMGDNQFVPEHGVRQEQVIGVVTEFYRGSRAVPTDALEYWIYCRLWCVLRPLRHLWRRAKGWIRRAVK